MNSHCNMWQDYLKSHPLLEKLRNDNVTIRNTKHILQNKADSLLLWDDRNVCIYSFTTKEICGDSLEYQTLHFPGTVSHDVDELLINPSGTLVALSGKSGVSVVILPQKWGKRGLFEGGKNIISCRKLCIADHFLASSGKIEILKSKWHPGSPTDTHLAVLTTDNCLQIYNVVDGVVPSVVINLGTPAFNTYLPDSKLSFMAALGETAVSFDFGSPNEYKSENHDSRNHATDVYWPIYVLFGNGEIYLINVRLEDDKPLVCGPLLMYPETEDNYGVDACSILCLHSAIPVLVIGTSKGRLYHSIVLRDPAPSEDSTRIWNPEGKSSDKEGDTSLYVYESVELDISMNYSGNTISNVMSSLSLQCDPYSISKYYCSHIGGLHSITVPIVNYLEEYTKQKQEMGIFDKDHECIVEHVLCTRVSSSENPAPLLGITFINLSNHGPQILVLLNDFNLIGCTLNIFIASNPPLLSEETEDVKYPLKKMHIEGFDEYIRKLLIRSTSQPYIAIPDGTNIDSITCLDVLNKVVNIYRDEYLHKFDLAHEELVRRVKILRLQKEQQLKDVSLLKRDSSLLLQQNGVLQEKVNGITCTQDRLLNRVEKLLEYVQKHLPILSQAEREMKEELQKVQSKLKRMKNSLEQLSVKENYQSRIMNDYNESNLIVSSNGDETLTENQISLLKGALLTQSQQIGNLLQQINNSKSVLGC